MSDINSVTLIGRLTRDPELRHTQNGTAVTGFSIASNKVYIKDGEKKEIVSFFNCIAWKSLGETIAKYCKKGSRIGIEGSLQQRRWEGQNGEKRQTIEIVANSIQFLDVKQESTQESTVEKVKETFDGQEVQNQGTIFDDDDIPF